jgi:RNA 3'-terminal phosphate cyclase (ATP)
VAESALDCWRAYEASGAPVGEHLADQLLLPLALAGGGEFLTMKPTLHTTTNIDTITKVHPARCDVAAAGKTTWAIRVT